MQREGRFRKKPVIIDAKVTDDRTSIETLEGVMTASAGDYIIFGVRQEPYPCKPDIMRQTYLPVGEDGEVEHWDDCEATSVWATSGRCDCGYDEYAHAMP